MHEHGQDRRLAQGQDRRLTHAVSRSGAGDGADERCRELLRSAQGWHDDGTPACNWTGITCQAGLVIAVNLSGWALQGWPIAASQSHGCYG